MSETAIEDDTFNGTLFPVFVTAEATLDQLNQLIRRSDEFIMEAHMTSTTDLYIISDASAAHPTTRQTWPLPASFESPYIGKSIADLVPIFKSKLSHQSDSDYFPEFVFGIVDSQTLKDGTVLCVSILKGDEAGKLEELRADVEIAAMVMMGPEVSGNGLTEGVEKGADGVYYERLDEEKRRHYIEGSDDEEEDEEEDDE